MNENDPVKLLSQYIFGAINSGLRLKYDPVTAQG